MVVGTCLNYVILPVVIVRCCLFLLVTRNLGIIGTLIYTTRSCRQSSVNSLKCQSELVLIQFSNMRLSDLELNRLKLPVCTEAADQPRIHNVFTKAVDQQRIHNVLT